MTAALSIFAASKKNLDPKFGFFSASIWAVSFELDVLDPNYSIFITSTWTSVVIHDFATELEQSE